MQSKQRFAFLLIGSSMVFAALAPGAATAKPSADYRFEASFASSVNGATDLSPEGPDRSCPPCQEFDRVKVNGDRQGVWRWPTGDGLRLDRADKLLGHDGNTYTISMLVNLETVEGYRKLVDFRDRQADEGWYAYSESLYPYDLEDFDYSNQVIHAGEWHHIVLTRDGGGFARGYVDGKLLGKDRDPNRHVALRNAGPLHFLIDDSGAEHSGGMIARLRIWESALDKGQVNDLND